MLSKWLYGRGDSNFRLVGCLDFDRDSNTSVFLDRCAQLERIEGSPLLAGLLHDDAPPIVSRNFPVAVPEMAATRLARRVKSAVA